MLILINKQKLLVISNNKCLQSLINNFTNLLADVNSASVIAVTKVMALITTTVNMNLGFVMKKQK